MENTSIGELIKKLRKEANLTLEQVGDAVGVGKSTVRKWENGVIANMKRDKIQALADVLGTTPMMLLNGDELDYEKYGLKPIKTQKIPLLGEIACGVPAFANENFTSYIEASSEIKADFCLVANGDSMKDARIFEGDIVFIRKQEMVENGEIAVVIIGDEATLKRIQYDREAGELKLIPENNSYSTIRLFGEELNSVRILGKAVAFMSDVR